MLILAGNGTAYLYSSADDDFVAARSVIPTPISGYYGPIAAGPERPVLPGERPGAEPGADADRLRRYRVRWAAADCPRRAVPSSTGRPVAAVAAVGGSSYARFSIPVTAANATPIGHGPGGSGGREYAAHHGDRGGAGNDFGDGARRGAGQRSGTQHGGGFGGHHRLRADRVRPERGSAGDRHPAERFPRFRAAVW